MKPYLQHNQQMQTKIYNIQTIAFNAQCRSSIEKMNYFVHHFNSNLYGYTHIQMKKNDYDENKVRLQTILGQNYQPILRQIDCKYPKDKEIQFLNEPIQKLIQMQDKKAIT